VQARAQVAVGEAGLGAQDRRALELADRFEREFIGQREGGRRLPETFAAGWRLLPSGGPERYDLQAAVPAGTSRNQAYARRVTTLGLAYKPLWNVVFKADCAIFRNRAGAGEDEALALGVGYQF